MAGMYGKHHCNGTNDQNKCHYTHKGERQISMAGTGKCVEHNVRVGPKILGEPDSTIRNKKGPKSESITHEKVPHHQLSILQVKWTFPSTPPICFCYSSCRHNSFQFISLALLSLSTSSALPAPSPKREANWNKSSLEGGRAVKSSLLYFEPITCITTFLNFRFGAVAIPSLSGRVREGLSSKPKKNTSK